MKILFVLDDFPPISYTGQSIVAYNLAQGLMDLGNEVIVIASVQNKSHAGRSFFDGISVYRIYSDYSSRFHDRFYHYISVYNPQIVPEFDDLVAEIKPDVCHFHNVHGFISYRCIKSASVFSKAVFLTAHDLLLVNYGKLWPKKSNCLFKIGFFDNLKTAKKRYNPLRNLFIRYYLKYVDNIFCISNGQREILELNGIRNTATVYNAINAEKWISSGDSINRFKDKFGLAGKKVILFGGRLSEAKGGEAIVRAMQLIRKSIDSAILVVVGKSDRYAEQMMELARIEGIGDSIIFTGWLDRSEMRSAFGAADVCVTPSIYFDPFNLFNIESMAAGKPVVGTRYGGTPEIVVDGETGYIVDPLKTDLLAEKISGLLANPELARKFGEAGLGRVKEKFSVSYQAELTLRNYNEVLKK